jgi:hypothetical protein
MTQLPDIEEAAKPRLTKIPDYEIKRQRKMYILCFALFIILAAGAFIAAAVIKSTMLAMFVLLILFFWLILTVIFVLRARKDFK